MTARLPAPAARQTRWDVPSEEYLQRLGCHGVVKPTVDFLRAVCSAHSRAVPYEMLDALDGRSPSLDHQDVFDKIVLRRGGSTCLEATPLLGRFLRDAGFGVKLVAAQAWRVNGQWAPRWDHLLLIVEAEGAQWVVDVSFLMLTILEPLRIGGGEQHQSGWVYQVAEADGHPAVLRRSPNGDWVPVYRFSDLPLEAGDYAWIVDYHMSADDSPLTGNLLCSRVIPDGKLILMRENFVRAEHGREHVDYLANTAEAEKAIGEIFHGHEHLMEAAVRTWESTRKRRGTLPGIG